MVHLRVIAPPALAEPAYRVLCDYPSAVARAQPRLERCGRRRHVSLQRWFYRRRNLDPLRRRLAE